MKIRELTAIDERKRPGVELARFVGAALWRSLAVGKYPLGARLDGPTLAVSWLRARFAAVKRVNGW